jgi:WD40 repeat protein
MQTIDITETPDSGAASVDYAPYVGPRPFKETENQLFFGRKKEVEELLSLITAHPVMLLYAPSGAGKTSLLNAGLIPKLRGQKQKEPDPDVFEDLEVFDVLKPMRVQGQLQSYSKVGDDVNIYMLNALSSVADETIDYSTLPGMTLEDFLKQRPKLKNEFGEPARQVVIFDQFEELFTAYPERWEDRKRFFEQVGEALVGDPKKKTKGDPLLRVVFSMREDYIAELDPYIQLLPECLRTRFRLEQMREKSALEAVEEPLKKRHISFAPNVAKQLVNSLLVITNREGGGGPKLGQYIEPVQLQILCQSLWEGLSPDEKVITQEHLDIHGDLSQVLSNFYEKGVRRVAEKTKVREASLRDWFENTLIVEGNRAPITRGKDMAGGMPTTVVELLEKRSLLKQEWRGGGTVWYELAHDSFIEPIRKSNEEWRAQQGIVSRTLARFEAKALKWQRGSGELLAGEELLAAQRLVHARVKTSPVLDKYVRASKAVAQQKRYRLYRWGVAALILLLIFTVFAEETIRTKKNQATSRLLALSARAKLDSDPEQSVLLAQKAAAEYGSTGATEELIRTGLSLLSTGTKVLRPCESSDGLPVGCAHYGRVNSVNLSPDGTRIVTAGFDDKKAFLWNWQTNLAPIELKRHSAGVSTASFSPDGKRVVTASLDGTAYVSDAVTGALISSMSQEDAIKGREAKLLFAPVNHALTRTVWSPDSQYIATASEDATVGIWNASTGENIETLIGHVRGVHDLAWSPDGAHIATEGFDGTGRIWKLKRDKPVLDGSSILLEGLTGYASAIAFSDDSKMLITESGPGRATVWNVETGKDMFALPPRSDAPGLFNNTNEENRATITSVNISPDNKLAIVADSDGAARIWQIDQAEPRLVSSLIGHATSIYVAKFCRDSTLVITGSADNTMRVWDAQSGQNLQIFRGHSGGVRSVSCSRNPDSQNPNNQEIIATGSDDGSVRVWDRTKNSNLLPNPRGQSSIVSSAAFSPDFEHNSLIAMTDYDGALRLWNARDGKTVTIRFAHALGISYAAFSRDGKSLVTASIDKTAKVWNITAGESISAELMFTLRGHTARVYKAAFSPDSKFIVTGSQDGTALVWNAATGEQVKKLERPDAGSTYTVYSVDYSPDGNSIITAGADGLVRIYDAHTYSQTQQLKASDKWVYSARYNPTGDLIVTAGADGTARVWKAATLKMVAELKGHSNEINSAVFSPNGQFVVTASDDKTTRVWDTKTWNPIIVLHGQKGRVLTAVFSPDSTYIVTASDDTTVHVYPPEMFAIPIDELLKQIDSRIKDRHLTPDEWKALNESIEGP